MSGLDERLREAQTAATAIAELDAKRALADELPSLLQEQQHEQRVAQVQANLAQTEAWARAEFSRLAVEATTWREDLNAALAILESLAATLPDLQAKVHGVVRRLQGASNAVVSAQHTGTWTEDEAFSARMTASDLFSQSLQESGGGDPGLACLPSESGDKLAEQVKDAIRRKAGGVMVYDPARGVAPYVNL